MSDSSWPDYAIDGTSVVEVIDSHTEGEPTRVVVAGGPDFGPCSPRDYRTLLAEQCDHFRTSVCCEPRGADHIVGAVLLPPISESATAGVVFFDNGGYLGMCGHGTIGIMRTLAYLGRIEPGNHALETPVGLVQTTLHEDLSVTFRNVPSYRFAKEVAVTTANGTRVRGDIAWGGNWFYLVPHPTGSLHLSKLDELTKLATEIRHALQDAAIGGADGQPITHVELTCGPHDEDEDGRNFVLCPGFQYDRSPCGTGTSAKVACLAAEGKLQPGQPWRQAGILGTRFEARYTPAEDGQVIVEITGNAWITAQTRLVLDRRDPLTRGIVK